MQTHLHSHMKKNNKNNKQSRRPPKGSRLNTERAQVRELDCVRERWALSEFRSRERAGRLERFCMRGWWPKSVVGRGLGATSTLRSAMLNLEVIFFCLFGIHAFAAAAHAYKCKFWKCKKPNGNMATLMCACVCVCMEESRCAALWAPLALSHSLVCIFLCPLCCYCGSALH